LERFAVEGSGRLWLVSLAGARRDAAADSVGATALALCRNLVEASRQSVPTDLEDLLQGTPSPRDLVAVLGRSL